MKKIENEFAPDGHFEYEGKTIYFRIVSDNKPIRMVRGVEKMSGYFNFFDGDGNNHGSIAFYENFEDMSPVRFGIPEKHYIELKKINKLVLHFFTAEI